MKTTTRIIVTALVLISGINLSKAQTSLQKDSIAMLASYSNEVYYSFTAGQVASVARNQWDIAFRTNIMSSSILVNDGVGVTLYSYPKTDSSGWASAWDTTGFSTWSPLYNDPTDWENGAFSRTATGHPDYGWGVYNSITHDLRGDSCFLIKTRDGGFKRIFIARKISVNNTYIFRVANLDGSNSTEISFACTPYMTKDFVGYDLQTMQAVDFQPAKNSWDILFTKYMSVQPDGTPYPVTGVLNNEGIGASKFAQVPVSYNNWGPQEFDISRSPIGWDWKYFDMNLFTYQVDDSLVYFLKNTEENVIKLVFERFDGSSTGKVVFSRGIVSVVGTPEIDFSTRKISTFPNPACDLVNYTLSSSINGNATITITDLAGRTMSSRNIAVRSGQTINGNIDVSALQSGLYLIDYQVGTNRESHKLIIQK